MGPVRPFDGLRYVLWASNSRPCYSKIFINLKLQEIACFSYDDQYSYHLGYSSLRYYYPPQLPADLNRGFETFQKLDDAADEHLDALLDTVAALEKESGKKCEADIITWRGMMTKVSYTPRLLSLEGLVCN